MIDRSRVGLATEPTTEPINACYELRARAGDGCELVSGHARVAARRPP